MKLIIDIPDKAYNRLLEEQHLPNRLDIEWVITHGTPIPDNATNGDMIKVMFPNIDFVDFTITVHASTKVTSNGVKGSISYDFWKDWWNAPYQKGGKDADSN